MTYIIIHALIIVFWNADVSLVLYLRLVPTIHNNVYSVLMELNCYIMTSLAFVQRTYIKNIQYLILINNGNNRSVTGLDVTDLHRF